MGPWLSPVRGLVSHGLPGKTSEIVFFLDYGNFYVTIFKILKDSPSHFVVRFGLLIIKE